MWQWYWGCICSIAGKAGPTGICIMSASPKLAFGQAAINSACVELPQLLRPSNHHYFRRLKPKSHTHCSTYTSSPVPSETTLSFIHHLLLFQSTKKISDNPIKFSSSLSSSEDDLPAHQSSEEDVSFDDSWLPSPCTMIRL
jgi:hypothetical protein